MQKVKGSVLKSRLDFVEEHFGEDEVQQVMASLSAEDQEALRKMLPSSWLSFEIGKRLDDAIVQVCGKGDPQFFEQLGVASADKNLTTLHSTFLTPGDPEAFLRKAPQIYELYYQTGRRAWEKTGESEGYLTTYDAETFSAADCLTVVGWYKRALAMCGATTVEVEEEECRALGGAVCRYRVRWE
ncbi:MAG: TIGR02265 family protein [Gemmatimonadota bacterium]|nr:MAG: TIGR02265 family protein [Gemmatimonadota bacterium]